jgi:formylglycine-generating enzyme required for sulfatase activity
MHLLLSLIVVALAAWIMPAPASAEKRVALVVGNSAYANVGRLANPANDASAMAALLKSAGFTVAELRDAPLAAFRRAVSDFSETANDADIAVFYFAGHGIEVDRANYLIPTDARLARDFDVADETVALDRVLQALEPARRLRLVILDACRNNPFISSMRRGARSVGRGLVRVEPPTADTLVAFAAKEGTIADDGAGANSPFTAALLRHLATPGLDIRLALGRVRDEVRTATQRKQEPFVYGSLGGHTVAIVSAPPVDAPPSSSLPRPLPTPDPCADAAAHFRAAEAIGTREALEDHIARFPSCNFAGLARARLAALIPPVQPATPPDSAPKPAVGVFPTAPGVTPLSAERERALKPKDTFKECDVCPEMVVMPAGSFIMGSPASEKGRNPAEGPQRRVMLARQFAVGKFAVTVDQFAAFVQETGRDVGSECYTREVGKWEQRPGRSWRIPGFLQSGSHPAVCISWQDAQAYVAWLSRTTGKTYRLLSEAEREYVARAGTTTPYWWGSSISTSQANYAGTTTAQVGTFQPNPWGLYQVHGNVWELMEDCWNASYPRGAPTDGSAWAQSSHVCPTRMLRGGSWSDSAKDVRAAVRGANTDIHRYSNIGLRVARTLAQ